ncbi:uncharacterized protein LOC114538367 [Dendronephthya gigantea]|uniref:uncharacterized protein LOC114538367 n=1 Tax=Dendronephthya gigantea TaxID=151771 RepID=UPI00106D0E96|nr:uncharacterized protein LOC114538367 [Dendronephthya gigantea]
MCDILSLAFFLKLLAIVAVESRQYQAGQLFRKQAGFRKVEDRGDSLASEEIISNHTVHSQLECSLKCLQSQACVGYNYRAKPKNKYAINCQLSNKTRGKSTNGEGNGKWTFYQELELAPYGSERNPGRSCEDILKQRCTDDIGDGIYWMTLVETNSSSDQPFPVYCDMENGGWTLVFKTIAGGSEVIGNIWKDSLTHKESSLEALNKKSSFKHYYKNRIVPDWKMFNPTKVRVVLYSQTKEKLVLSFNASGTNNMDWFSVDRLQQPPWQDIVSSPKNVFSIDGECLGNLCRSFFINSIYNGCPGDEGWFMVGSIARCAWEKRFPGNSFQYSKNDKTRVIWSQYDKVGTAEVFTVYLR